MEWNVDVFKFNSVSGDNPLLCSTYIIFNQRKLFTNMNIRPRTFVNFMANIQVCVCKLCIQYTYMPLFNVCMCVNVLMTGSLSQQPLSQCYSCD